MIVRGESTIIDYHAPFDQGLSKVTNDKCGIAREWSSLVLTQLEEKDTGFIFQLKLSAFIRYG